MQRRVTLALVLLTIISLLSAGCGGGTPAPAPAAKPAEPAKPAEAKPAAPQAAAPAANPTAAAAAPKPSGDAAAKPSGDAAAKPASGLPPVPTVPEKSREVKVGWTPNFIFLPVVVGRDLGYFKEYGIDLKMVDFQGGGEVTAAMLGRSVDTAATMAERPIILADKGQPAINMLHLLNGQAFTLVTRKDLNVKPGDWEALKGKKIGVTTPGGGTDTTLRSLLKYNKLEPDKDVAILYLGGVTQQIAALQAKSADGVFNSEPMEALARQQGLAEVFLDLRKEGPQEFRNVGFTTLQATAEWIKANPEATKALIAGTSRALKKMREEPAIAVKSAKAVFPNLDDKLLDEVIGLEKVLYHPDISPDAIKNLNSMLKIAGTIKQDAKFEDVVVGPEFQAYWAYGK